MSSRPKWSKMIKNGLKLYKMVHSCHFLPVKNGSYLSKWRAWRVLAKALRALLRVFWVLSIQISCSIRAVYAECMNLRYCFCSSRPRAWSNNLNCQINFKIPHHHEIDRCPFYQFQHHKSSMWYSYLKWHIKAHISYFLWEISMEYLSQECGFYSCCGNENQICNLHKSWDHRV